METDRLVIRAPVEADRRRFVDLFTDEAFTVFWSDVLDVGSAGARFDQMLALAATLPYAKQPIVEKSTGRIVGYTGVGSIVIDGLDRLEWGWRLTPDARGRGYATEATAALLTVADAHHNGEVICVIAADNDTSLRVAHKVGFYVQRHIVWSDGVPTVLLVRPLGAGGPPLLAPVGGPVDSHPFDLGMLSVRIDQARSERKLSMAALAREVGVSASTIRRFGAATDAEADGVLAVVAWLGESPERFITGSLVDGAPLPPAGAGQIRVDMDLVVEGRSNRRVPTRTTIQRLAIAAQTSRRSVASLTRWSQY